MSPVPDAIAWLLMVWLAGDGMASAGAPMPSRGPLAAAAQAGLPRDLPTQPTRRFADLVQVRSPRAAADGSGSDAELTVSWVTAAGVSNPLAPGDVLSDPVVSVVAQRVAPPGSAVRERHPELSEDQLVVVLADSSGRPLSWHLIRDPRVLRSEQPGPSGLLSGTTFLLPSVEFPVTVRMEPAASQIQFWHPRWSGGEWWLDLLGETRVALR